MHDRRFAGAVYHAAFRQIHRDRWFFLIAVTIGASPDLLAPWLMPSPGARGMDFVTSLITLYLQILATFRTLADHGAAPAGYVAADKTEARFPSVFAANLLQGVAVALGLLLLVVPGVLLFLLWSLSTPVIAAERAGATDAMRRSWQLTRGSLGGLAFVAAGFVLGGAAAFALPVLWLLAVPSGGWIADGMVACLLSMLLMASPVVWTMAYLALRGGVSDRAPARAA